MRMAAGAWRWLAVAGAIVLVLIVGMMVMNGNAGNGPTGNEPKFKLRQPDVRKFKLKAPQAYFADARAIELLMAALAGDLEQARKLVAQGADPNEEGPRDNDYNRIRLLHYAIAANDLRAIRVLMAVGADPELPSIGFGRAFLFAKTLDNIEALSTLLDLRPLHTLSRDTLKPLWFGSLGFRPRVMLLLLERGLSIDYQDDADYTALMRAMDGEDYDLAGWLIERGASVVIETKYGVTPANVLEFHLRKFRPGTPTHNKLLQLKQMMQERGAVFPAPEPEEVVARRQAGQRKPAGSE